MPAADRRPERAALAACAAALLLVVAAKPAPHTPPQAPKAAAAKPARPDGIANPDTTAAPNFSGVWKLSTERSVFGKIPGGQPTARTASIRHDEPRIRQVLYLVNGTRRDTTTYVYATDGTPTKSVVDGRDIHSIVGWEGRVLHLRSTTKLLMLDMSLDERWQLSANARELTMRRHVKWVLGEGDQTLVFERQ